MYNVKGFKNQKTIGKFDDVFIRSKLDSILDENGDELPQYSEPINYKFNIMPITDEAEIREFGEMVSQVRTTVIEEYDKYKDDFKEFDLAYLEYATPDNESYIGEYANFEITSVRKQNSIIKLFFTQIIK